MCIYFIYTYIYMYIYIYIYTYLIYMYVLNYNQIYEHCLYWIAFSTGIYRKVNFMHLVLAYIKS